VVHSPAQRQNSKIKTVMEKLFIEKSIEINAPIEKVWKILTDYEFTKQWVKQGWGKIGIVNMNVYSDWKPGSEVLWKKETGTVLVSGKVTKLNPYKLLHFTAFDVNNNEKFISKEEDGITYKFNEQKGNAILTVRHGNFAVLREGKKNYENTKKVWDAVLPKIKELAEADMDAEEVPTCGKGLAENSTLPARFSELIAAMAENLELHTKTLDLSDGNARLENEVYEKLVKTQRDIAARLMTLAGEIYSYYDLPIAKHDEKKLSDPKIAEAFKNFTLLEQELIIMLNKRRRREEKILAEIHEG
jgi:uncharacterized protein YndB with AHSA1/START domain